MKRALLLAALLPWPAFAYNGGVHAFITRQALPPDRRLAPPTQEDPDEFVDRTPQAQAAIEEFYAIEIRGLRRAVTAVREWRRRFPGNPHDLVPQLVAYHEAAAARRAAYKPGAGHPRIAWGYPIAVVAVVGAAAAVARRKVQSKNRGR